MVIGWVKGGGGGDGGGGGGVALCTGSSNG